MKTSIVPSPPKLAFFERILRASCLISLSAAFMMAQSTAPSPAPTPEKMNPPASTVPEAGRFDPVRFNNQSSSHYYYQDHELARDEAYVFFPPVTPPLDADYPLLQPLDNAPPARTELTDFVGDFFYSLLATRLATGDLPKDLRTRLQVYRTAKLSLQNQLRTRLTAISELAAERQAEALAAFATAQSAEIRELEKTAATILTDLYPSSVFGFPTDKTDLADSAGKLLKAARDTPSSPPVRARAESFALRVAAFYQRGLSLPQRGLLLEAAIELADDSSLPAANAPPEQGWLLRFSPETARIHLLATIPAPLAKKISEYVAAKQILKSELVDSLLASATARTESRTAAMKDLAVTQAARIAGLEPAAEEIRRDLATLPNPPGPPAAPVLPPELAARISTYRMHKVEVLKTLYHLLGRPNGESYRKTPEEDPASGVLSWMHNGTTQVEVKASELKVSTAEFNGAQARLLDELNREQAGIRAALAEYFRSSNQSTGRKSINDLLKEFETAREKQEIWDKYRDYQTAVLMPGLSPEQRRLLFDAGVEKLSLPLPGGEIIP